MNKIVWFIDSFDYPIDPYLEKVIRLSESLSIEVSIALDLKDRFKERSYWSRLVGTLNEEYEALESKANQLISYISRRFAEHDIELSVIKFKDVDCIDSLIKETKKSLLLLNASEKLEKHPVYFNLAKLTESILLIGNKPWRNQLAICAAVDPLHENDRPSSLDNFIFSKSEYFKKNFNASCFVIHSCYTPPSLSKYRKKILDIHREALFDFSSSHGVAKSKAIVIEGVPEEVLPGWLHKNNIDILFIGLVARSKLAEMWIGSTTASLLKSPPCDMFLVRTKK